MRLEGRTIIYNWELRIDDTIMGLEKNKALKHLCTFAKSLYSPPVAIFGVDLPEWVTLHGVAKRFDNGTSDSVEIDISQAKMKDIGEYDCVVRDKSNPVWYEDWCVYQIITSSGELYYTKISFATAQTQVLLTALLLSEH